MSFYSDASLVMIPSGYKTSKVYCAVPTDGAADLSFSRSNDTATRVGPDGLIEKVRTNLVPNGLLFVSSTGVDYTTITIDSPISGVSSTSITKNEAAGTLRYGIQTCSIPTIASNTTYTISRFFKYDGVNTTTSLESNDGGQWSGTFIQNINIASTGVTLGAPSGCTSKITNVGSGWYRVDVTIAVGTVTVGGPVTYLLQVASALSTGQGFLTAAPQLETSDIATDYILTTSGAVSVGPVANVPRLDYLGSSCPRLLLEPQRTNIITYSESFDNAVWTKTSIAVTANATTSPDGYDNADLFTTNAPAGTVYRAYHNSTGGTDATNTISGFFKYGNHPYAYITADYSGLGNFAIFNVQTGVVTFTSTGYTSTITDYGNGWYRCTLTGTMDSNNNVQFGLSVSATAYAGTSLANGKTLYVWGAQREYNVSYASSYVNTLGAAVTRGADAALKTSISSLIGQDEGTIFVEFEYNYSDSTTQVLFKANQTTDANSVGIEVQNTTIKGLVNSAGGNIATITGTIATGTIKAALAYKTNDMAFYVNGTQVGVDTSGSIAFAGVVDILTIGQFLLNGGTFFPASRPFNQALVFKTRLSNADLAALTA
jgi:hypothetical protein